MKKLKVLLIILLSLIILNCQTIKETEYITVKYILPPFPEREKIILPENPNLKDYPLIINYYEALVSKWELWGETTKKILQGEF